MFTITKDILFNNVDITTTSYGLAVASSSLDAYTKLRHVREATIF